MKSNLHKIIKKNQGTAAEVEKHSLDLAESTAKVKETSVEEQNKEIEKISKAADSLASLSANLSSSAKKFKVGEKNESNSG